MPRAHDCCDDIPLNSTPSHVMLLSYVNVFKNTSNLSSAAAPLYKTKGQRHKVCAETWLYMMHGTIRRAGSLLCEIWHYAPFVIPVFFFQPHETEGRRICNVRLCSTERRWHESERPSQHFLNLFSNDIMEHESQSIRWGRIYKVRRVEIGFNKDINTYFF